MADKRRTYKRIDIKTKGKWKKLSHDDEASGHNMAMAKDISRGGICITVEDKILKVDDRLELDLDLPDGESITVATRVAWVMGNFKNFRDVEGLKYDVGLEFVDISEENMNKIEKLFRPDPTEEQKRKYYFSE